MTIVFDRKEKARIGARSSERRANFSFGEMDGFAGEQIRSNDCQRNSRLSEIFRFRETVEEIYQTLVGSHAHAGKRPAAKIAEARKGALSRYFVEGSPAGVRCSD